MTNTLTKGLKGNRDAAGLAVGERLTVAHGRTYAMTRVMITGIIALDGKVVVSYVTERTEQVGVVSFEATERVTVLGA